jgi:hypothetical protein
MSNGRLIALRCARAGDGLCFYCTASFDDGQRLRRKFCDPTEYATVIYTRPRTSLYSRPLHSADWVKYIILLRPVDYRTVNCYCYVASHCALKKVYYHREQCAIHNVMKKKKKTIFSSLGVFISTFIIIVHQIILPHYFYRSVLTSTFCFNSFVNNEFTIKTFSTTVFEIIIFIIKS